MNYSLHRIRTQPFLELFAHHFVPRLARVIKCVMKNDNNFRLLFMPELVCLNLKLLTHVS